MTNLEAINPLGGGRLQVSLLNVNNPDCQTFTR
jgi:hypothetical protein